MSSKTLVVNFFAGPGAGKSTLAAGLFAELKQRGVNCELATEYAKDKVWEESFGVFRDQLYVFAKQAHRIRRLLDKVAVVITDSPLLLSMYYAKGESVFFKDLVLDEHRGLRNLNIYVLRTKKYEPSGRFQTELQAQGVDNDVLRLLIAFDVPYTKVPGNLDEVREIADTVQEMIK